MGIRRTILNGLASWILKQIPAEKPNENPGISDNTTRNESSNDGLKDAACIVIEAKPDHGLIAGPSLFKETPKVLDFPPKDATEDKLEQQFNANIQQPFQERGSISEFSRAGNQLNPAASENNPQAELKDCAEQQETRNIADRNEFLEDSGSKEELTGKSINSTRLIDILELPEELETKLKETNIYYIDDLNRLGLDEIKRILDYKEDSLTELMASLVLKGCRVPTFTERSASESTKASKDSNEESELIRVTTQTDTPTGKRFLIPDEPIQPPSHKWIPKDNSVVIAETTIPGGLIYVGKRLPTITGDNDPCLIDPTKEVALSADFNQRLMGYWPSYSNISAEARRAYLNWLAAGKGSPNADIGYVFLYFYGLERRIVVDYKTATNANGEIADISDELRRLLSIYGKRSKSFKRYATGLLDWIAIKYTSDRMYKILGEHELLQDVKPQSIRLALGQAAIDNACLPAVVALHWARLDSTVAWSTEIAKSPTEFFASFQKLYQEAFGDGLRLPINDQVLKLNYVSASSSLRVRDISDLVLEAEDVPDVKLSKATKKIFLGILKQACLNLESFARSADQAADIDAVSDTENTLPSSPWSEATLEGVRKLKDLALSGPLVIEVESLAEKLKITMTDTRDDFIEFLKLLSQFSLFVIPDVKSGAAVPRINDQVVIYKASPITGNSQQSAKFNAANIALQLASAVAASDGEFSDSEHEHLLGKLKGWSHLDDNQILHLEANLYYLKVNPAKLNSVKLNQIRKKLEYLDEPSRTSIAEFIALVAQVDGVIVKDEIKTLEKIYKVLDLDCSMIYTNLHNGVVNNSAQPSSFDTKKVHGSTNDLELDASRIAQLQQDTERGYELLASIFSEPDEIKNESTLSSNLLTQRERSEGEDKDMILGLDSTLSIFACQLMKRLSWSRSDLLVVARELGLMLDGALESINEASYDKLDLPFSEGDDPVEINPDALSRLSS